MDYARNNQVVIIFDVIYNAFVMTLNIPRNIYEIEGAKGCALDAADQLFSTSVSWIRQPIGSLFAWIEQQSDIESTSKVRSYEGLIVHVFGRLVWRYFWGTIYDLALNLHLKTNSFL